MQDDDNTRVLTPEGLKKLKEELAHLKTVRRREVLEQLQAARESADVWQSQDFLEAKNVQSFVEGRIQTIEKMLAEFRIIEAKGTDGRVGLGSEVVLINEEGDEEQYTIVGTAEADPSLHRLSAGSPVGRALLGKSAGDNLEVIVPSGTRHLKLLWVR